MSQTRSEEALFAEALKLPAAARDDYLREACGDDNDKDKGLRGARQR